MNIKYLNKRCAMKYFFFLAAWFGFVITPSVHAAEEIKFLTDPPQRVDVRFRLFKTHNMWTFLELDTQTGRIWQIQFSVDKDAGQVKIPINDKSLSSNSKNGRYTMYPTDNIWTFLLVDQDVGQLWQVQFSLEDGNRFFIPIFSLEELEGYLKGIARTHKKTK